MTSNAKYVEKENVDKNIISEHPDHMHQSIRTQTFI